MAGDSGGNRPDWYLAREAEIVELISKIDAIKNETMSTLSYLADIEDRLSHGTIDDFTLLPLETGELAELYAYATRFFREEANRLVATIGYDLLYGDALPPIAQRIVELAAQAAIEELYSHFRKSFSEPTDETIVDAMVIRGQAIRLIRLGWDPGDEFWERQPTTPTEPKKKGEDSPFLRALVDRK